MSQQPVLNYSAEMSRQELRTIASRQRAIMLCILAYLTALVCQFLVPAPMRPLVAIVALGASITSMVFVFRLATRIYGTALGIVLGILVLIPLLGLIVLLIVNGKATTILKSQNIRVGLLGADLNTI